MKGFRKLEWQPYDADGNLVSDARFEYAWDAENRLVAAIDRTAPTETSPTGGVRFVVSNLYDHASRRIAKTVFRPEADGMLLPESEYAFLYDGWNPILETRTTPTTTNALSYLWGLDLSGSLQGAGGVGGLLAVTDSETGTSYPTYDANGNVSEYVSPTGAILAHYDYSPFGELLISTAPHPSPFRFSTKYHDPETDTLYYGYRHYSPRLGRWLSRDPIEEDGGENLNAVCENNPIDEIDALGLVSIADIVLTNIGYDRSGPLLGPYGVPVPSTGARLQIQFYFSGNFSQCCKNGHKTEYAIGTLGIEAFLTRGQGRSRRIKGRDRNKPDPYRPGLKMKNHPTYPPDSGFRSRSWHIDTAIPVPKCPRTGLTFQHVSGSIFLRGSAGAGVGVQFNIQKDIRPDVDITEGWSASLSLAMGIWGSSVDFGGGGSASWTYVPD